MAAIEHRNIDLWSTDPFRQVEFLNEPQDNYFEDAISAADDIETEIPASRAQVQILQDDTLQWCQISLVLPRSPPPTLDQIQWTWKALTSHHACLRTVLHVDTQSGNVYQRVRLRGSQVEAIEDPTWTPQSSVPSTPGVGGMLTGDQARLTVYRYPLSPHHRVTLHVHRAMVDSSSLSLIKRDFALLYCGLPLPERTPLTYYLKQHMESKDEAISRAFWSQTLNDIPAGTHYAALSPTAGSRRATISMTLGESCATGLARLEVECGWPRLLVFEALWATVLHYHSASRDVIFAGVRRDAGFPGVESCVGFLDQTYPVRVSVEPNETFSKLFTKLCDYHASASSHAYLGYKEITRGLPKLVNTVITYSPGLNGPTTAGQLMGFPMAVFITGTSPVQITCCYSSEIPTVDAEVLLQHFAQAISSAVRKFYLPHSLVGHIELASEEEQMSLIRGAIQTSRTGHRPHSTIVELFEQQASRIPDLDAVQFEDERALTFGELNVQANQLARLLGPVRGEIIAVLIDRSTTLIVTILAILKAGGAYTILDPDGSVDRNRQIVESCDAPLVLANRVYCGNMPKAQPIEDCLYNLSSLDGSKLALDLQPEERCYVIYTSGSTGVPKGVVISHGAAATGMQYHSLNGFQRCLLFYSPTFSAAQRTMLSTLVHGGTLLLCSKQRLMTSLGEVLKQMRVEALGITPSALSILEPEQIPDVKQITLVGEKIPQELVDAWADKVHLRNTYGLSECTQLNFSNVLKAGGNPRVLGRPLDTTQAYVLQPGTTGLSPIGVMGELCLAGPQLASGYLKDIEQTDKVFVPNPFGTGRLYRTGDVARALADGSFEIIGRIDFQVKINGQKVNPAEIDAALVQHEDVISCATVALSHAGGLRLVSAIVLKSASLWSAALPSLRQHASRALPSYMVPSFWMPLEALPITSNGKTDIKKLENMAEELGVAGFAQMDAADQGSNSRPLDEVEAKIAGVWSEVLGVPLSTIGPDHSFVRLGGSSVDAIKTLGELRKCFLVLELTTLLDDISLETAAALADHQDSEAADNDPENFSLIGETNELVKDTSITDAYPATPLQESILAASLQLDDDHYAYQRVWDVSALDKGQLRTSFETVFARSDILRTSFTPHKRGFMQLLRADMALPWVELDQELDAYLAADKKQRLSISGPMVRIALLSERFLVVTMHHALFDFWSHRFLYDDVAAVYRGMSLLPRPPFKRFVKHIEGLDRNQNDSFWKGYLSNVEPTQLNTVPVEHSSTVSQTLPFDLGKALQPHGISAATAIYTAWALVLSKRAGSEDVLFATTISGRETAVLDVDRLDGPTLTLTPQRVSVSPEDSLLELMRSVGKGVLQIIRYSPHGMRNALAAAQLRPDCMDTMVNILISPDDQNNETEQVFRPVGPRPVWESEFTTLEITDVDGKISVMLTGKMEQRHAQFVLDSFCRTIEAIAQHPGQAVETLAVMGDSERDLLSNDLSNRNSLHVPEPELLHDAFERHAVQSPDAIAIDWDGEKQVTYAQLDRMANQMAHLLTQGFHVAVGDIVPLMLDKSINTVVALLGVMKAGAAYVPLSPDNPPDRNAFIVNEVQAKIAITETQHSAMIGVDGITALYVDEVQLGDFPSDRPNVDISPDCLAYLIYTSGSTGMPKGVKVPHRAAAAAVVSMAQVEGRHHGEWRTLQFANYVFDASVQDFFNTLSTAGTLCMGPADKVQSDLPGAIQTMAARQSILTPTVAQLLSPEDVPTLKTLIVGGEPLTKTVIEKWLPYSRILNVYGPTETSMVVSTKAVTTAERPNNIGAPFPTVMAFILQPDGLDLVPYGAPGELCIAGPQVTDAYLARDELTDSVFLRNELLKVDRMYRTGDLARWLPGGEIECLGRKDNQVKIHGHRIELGEIEQAILQAGPVQNTVVIPLQVNGKSQLGAFCIFKPSPSTEIQDAAPYRDLIGQLRDQLTTLPPYMIPKYAFPLGDLPKLPSRKTDRKTLKAQVEAMDALQLNQYSLDCEGTTHEVAPVETDAEIALEELWSRVLAVPPEGIGKKANFLALGGDSIAAISLASLARGAGYTLSVKNILKAPRLDAMAITMTTAESPATTVARPFETPLSVTQAVQEVGLRSDDVDYIYPAPPGQVEFLEQGHRPEQMWVLMAVRRMGVDFDQAKWIEATAKMTQLDDILRTSWLRVSNVEWYGVVLKTVSPNIVVTPCRDDGEREQFLEQFWERRFTFGNPFIKYAILTYPDQTCDVVIKMDHAVYDGTLLRIFDDHFSALCRGVQLPEHGQFREFAFSMYQSDRETTRTFWKNTLAGKCNRFPDCERPRITASIKKLISTDLDIIARATGVTTPIVFQAAYQLWLSQSTGTPDVSFDYLLSGRNVDLGAIDPQTVNGTLANFLPVRSLVSPSITLDDYLQETQDMFWAITENGNVGLDEIYSAAGVSRHAAGNRSLFLFQPFEPSTKSTSESENLRWLVMAKSQVRMFQPYGLVVEVARALESQHRLTVMYDQEMFNADQATNIAEHIMYLVDIIAEYANNPQISLQKVLHASSQR